MRMTGCILSFVRVSPTGTSRFFFQAQWHLNGGARGGFDMNVQPAWDRGFTGKGVVVTILDDGIQTNHPELRDNYDPQVNNLGM